MRTGCGFRVEVSASPGRANQKIVLMKGFMCVVVIAMKLDGETLPPSESQSNV